MKGTFTFLPGAAVAFNRGISTKYRDTLFDKGITSFIFSINITTRKLTHLKNGFPWGKNKSWKNEIIASVYLVPIIPQPQVCLVMARLGFL